MKQIDRIWTPFWHDTAKQLVLDYAAADEQLISKIHQLYDRVMDVFDERFAQLEEFVSKLPQEVLDDDDKYDDAVHPFLYGVDLSEELIVQSWTVGCLLNAACTEETYKAECASYIESYEKVVSRLTAELDAMTDPKDFNALFMDAYDNLEYIPLPVCYNENLSYSEKQIHRWCSAVTYVMCNMVDKKNHYYKKWHPEFSN